MILLYFWNCHFLYWKPVEIFLLKINWFLPASFFYRKSTRIFLLKINWFLIAILYCKSMKNFLLKNNWFVSFKNLGLPFIFYIGIFKDIFFIDFAILLKLPFFIKNQHTFFYWKSIGFASIIFLLKINTKISIELPVHFQPAILYWKRIQFFLLKINWFFSASFFYWKLEVIFLLILIYMKLRFCIENQWKILYWKSIDLTASKT